MPNESFQKSTYREALLDVLQGKPELLDQLESNLDDAKIVFESQDENTLITVLGIKEFLVKATERVSSLLKSEDRLDDNAQYAMKLMQAGEDIIQLVDRLSNWNWGGYINNISSIQQSLAEVDPLNHPTMPEINYDMLAQCRNMQHVLDVFNSWAKTTEDVTDPFVRSVMMDELRNRLVEIGKNS